MPEGPELHLASKFVNEVSEGRLFSGPVQKSAVSKSCDVEFSSPCYSITSESRGKELALTLACQKDARNQLRLLFRFGMSGRFAFGPNTQLHKHAHLKFFTSATASGDSADAVFVLSFVDPRRFGSWQVTGGWGKDRGADPMLEYGAFRSNILDNLDDTAFNKPICEAMLNQKYFNGIGNYLRAEILYRSRIPPFVRARDALTPLKDVDSCSDASSDVLQLCHSVPLEVLKVGKYISTYTEEEDMKDSPFSRWLQCYLNPLMRNMVDHNGRTIWFSGEAGPLAPKGAKTRHSGSKPKANKPKSVAVKKEAVGGVALELLNDVRCVHVKQSFHSICAACLTPSTTYSHHPTHTHSLQSLTFSHNHTHTHSHSTCSLTHINLYVMFCIAISAGNH